MRFGTTVSFMYGHSAAVAAIIDAWKLELAAELAQMEKPLVGSENQE